MSVSGATFGPYYHQLNRGGLAEILSSQQLIATPGTTWGGLPAVRAVPGKVDGITGNNTYIEFMAYARPDPWRYMGEDIVRWVMDEGSYLDIKVLRVRHSDGRIEVIRPSGGSGGGGTPGGTPGSGTGLAGTSTGSPSGSGAKSARAVPRTVAPPPIPLTQTGKGTATALAVQILGEALAGYADRVQQEKAARAVEALLPAIEKEMDDSPDQGVLIGIVFHRLKPNVVDLSARTMIKPTFKWADWVAGQTREEADFAWRDMKRKTWNDLGDNEEEVVRYHWLPPHKPVAAKPKTSTNGFSSTFAITKRLPKSRVFKVSGGKVVVESSARWDKVPRSKVANYSITLWLSDWVFDNDQGTGSYPIPDGASFTWSDLAAGDYYLEIKVENSDDSCTLNGKVTVKH